jgi:cation diffusion facilitator family transporter
MSGKSPHDHGRPHGDPHHGNHDHAGHHRHSHGIIDPSITSSGRGLWAVKWSFVGLAATAAFQIVVVVLSGSVALLADTIHNFGDAATALPLGIAFLFSRKPPTSRFTFGYGRIEDLAGFAVVLTILASALIAGYQSIDRLLHPQDVSHLWAVIAASLIGFVGNEAVAIFRIRVGKEIGSAALIADGYHARTDGWTSLAVLVGTVGVWMSFPLADPLVGMVITIAIFGVVLQSGKAIFTRMLDGVEPELVEQISHAVSHVPKVESVTDVRARWLGHRLHAEINISVPSQMTVADGHEISAEVRHQLLHTLRHLSIVVVHVDPVEMSGERHHHIESHSHNGLPVHSHAA